jgi:hypothetical protein
MVLPVGLVSLANQDKDVHPLHVPLHLIFTYGARRLPLLSLWLYL